LGWVWLGSQEHSKLQFTCFTRTKVQLLTQKAEF
jgi:hypothetical protein